MYHFVVILEGGICGTIKVSSETKASLQVKPYLGTYKYIGVYGRKNQEKNFPVYELKGTNKNGYLIKDFGREHWGWVILVIVIYINYNFVLCRDNLLTLIMDTTC